MSSHPIIEAMLERNSTPARMLDEPAPSDSQLKEILECGLRAPDHAGLRPWRFVTVRGQARHQLADVFVEAARLKDPDLSDAKLAAIHDKPLRSPMTLMIVATITAEHPKTPEVEQILSAGAATGFIQLAADAMGFGTVWVTGSYAYDQTVKAALGVASQDHIVGFLHIGTPSGQAPRKPRPQLDAHLSDWTRAGV